MGIIVPDDTDHLRPLIIESSSKGKSTKQFMKRILFPTDFSENSNDALEYLLAMSKGQVINLKIIHVADPSNNMRDTPFSTIELINNLTSKSERALRKVVQSIENDNDSIKIETEVFIGNPVLKIPECAQLFSPDLIVLGNKGENHSISDKILGITSLTLSDEADYPVLLVPKDYKFEGIFNALYPTNLDYSDPYILWKSMNAIAPHKPVIRCLHVKTKFDPQISEQEAFAKYMVDHSPSIQTIFHTEEEGDTEENLIDFAENYECQLMIMHKTKRSFLGKLFSKSLTQKMRRHVNLPLLIMNIKT